MEGIAQPFGAHTSSTKEMGDIAQPQGAHADPTKAAKSPNSVDAFPPESPSSPQTSSPTGEPEKIATGISERMRTRPEKRTKGAYAKQF